jgi:hypothetical protein
MLRGEGGRTRGGERNATIKRGFTIRVQRWFSVNLKEVINFVVHPRLCPTSLARVDPRLFPQRNLRPNGVFGSLLPFSPAGYSSHDILLVTLPYYLENKPHFCISRRLGFLRVGVLVTHRQVAKLPRLRLSSERMGIALR